MLRFIPAINSAFEIDLLFGDWVGDFVHLRKWSRIIVQKIWSFDVPWCWLRWTCSAIRSCTSDWMNWQPFSSVTWAFFSCTAVHFRQASFHIWRNLFTICFFWNNKYIECRLRCFCFLWWSLLCKGLLSAVQLLLSLVLCFARRFPSAVRGRIDSFSLETTAPLYILLFRTFPDSSLRLMIFVGELGRNCVVAQDTPVRCLIESQRILRCFQIHHNQSVMMVLHVEVRLVLRVGVRIQWRNDWEVHCFSAFAFSKSLWHKSTKFLLNFHVLRIQHDTAIMHLLSRSCWVKASTCTHSRLSDIAELWRTWVLPIENGYDSCCCHCWHVISAPSFQQTSNLSFFVWLVSFPRIWYGVSPLISCLGSLFWGDPMCSLQGRCSCSVTFSNVPRQRGCLFGCTWLRLFWKITWEWNNRPILFLESAVAHVLGFPRLSMWHSAGFSWAFGRLIDLIFCQNDPTYCCNLTTILNFFRARVEPNQYLRVACAWHSHISASASFFFEKYFFLWAAQFCFWD